MANHTHEDWKNWSRPRMDGGGARSRNYWDKMPWMTDENWGSFNNAAHVTADDPNGYSRASINKGSVVTSEEDRIARIHNLL